MTTTTDPRVDAYVTGSAPFAQPILQHIRAAMHAACPDVRETVKWSHPFFLLEGRIFANMSAFKGHCGLGFWKAGRAVAEAAADPGRDKAMGQFGRIESLADLPTAAALRKLIVTARKEFEAAADAPVPRKPPRAALPMPDDLAAALRTDAAASGHFDAFAPGQRREYIEWIVEARREATRTARVAQAVEWIAQGKVRNWKYQDC